MNRRSALIFTLAAVVILSFGRPAVADTARGLFDSAKDRYERLLASEKRRSSKSMWLEVINAFDRIVKAYPRSDEAALALFTEGCIYREMFNYSITLGELNQAEKTFRKFLEKYPGHKLAADAKKNIEEITDQKKNSNLVRVSAEKPKPEDFPGRGKVLKDDTHKESGGVDTTKTGTVVTTTATKAAEKPISPKKGSSGTSIEKIRYFTDTAHTRIVVDLDSGVSYDAAALPRDDSKGIPPRIYVDLFGTRTASNLYSPLTVKDGLVSRVRWSKKKDGTIRVVLDLERGADYKVFSLFNPDRLVIDVLRN